MYENILSQIGLSAHEALIYELLLQNGEQKAAQIAIKSELKRGLVYKILSDLMEKGLVTKDEPAGKVASFTASHPDKLRDFADEHEKSATSARAAVEGVLPNLLSSFNLAAGKPGTRFYEGEEGIKKVWWDTLNQNAEILTMGDSEFLMKNFEKLNKAYFKERQKSKIKKRTLSNDSPFNRDVSKTYDTSGLTESRLLTAGPINFSSVVMQIYANKISYTVLSGETLIGVIIEDKQIYEMYRNLFEYLWAGAKKQEEIKPKSMYDLSGMV